MRAASRDAEGPEASEASETANGEEGETRATYDDDEARRRSISSRARKIRRRVSLVASADASRRWRDASALTSAALANLGVLRFKAADPSSRARGGSASFFHRAWTYAENNPELGPSHPHTAWARGWFDIAGGYDAAASDAGRASASMLDAVFENEWGRFNVRSALATPRPGTALDSKSDSKRIGTPAFRDGFETAWGVLAGETSAAVGTAGVGAESAECEPCVVANDATPRKVPVLAELGSFGSFGSFGSLGAAASSGTVFAEYPEYPEYPDRIQSGSARRFDALPALPETIGASYGSYGSRDESASLQNQNRRPSVSVALERFRPTERAVSSWRLFWSDADAAHAARLDDLDVDLALASIVDDVANGAVGKHSEKTFSAEKVDEARKRSTAFAAAARRAATSAANASSFLFDDSVWGAAVRRRGREDPGRDFGGVGRGCRAVPDGPRRTHRFEPVGRQRRERQPERRPEVRRRRR